ncbi:MAG TPA: DinB family protein, partial [Candidatus Eisenbacteria bacterium]
ENGSAPAVLQGRTLEFYDGLLERARAHSRAHAMTLTDADLARQITRQRPDGNRRVFDIRWMVYHLLEHQAGHHAQILMLRHLQRAPRATPVRGGG